MKMLEIVRVVDARDTRQEGILVWKVDDRRR
jgi:hypothetical protein